jgi:hypothetical protein
MKPEDAEEYTQALGQVVAGGWRQIALGQRLGVPQALKLSVDDWVKQRLGGYVKYSIEERTEAIRALAGEGFTEREIKGAVGTGRDQVRKALVGTAGTKHKQKLTERKSLVGPAGTKPLDVLTGLAATAAIQQQIGKGKSKAEATARSRARREASQRALPSTAFDLRIGDAREVLADVPSASVHLVLTDPPYGDDAEPLYHWLAEWSARVLIDGGSLICFTGHSRLDRDLRIFTQHLRWWWLLAMRHNQAQRLPGKFVMVEFKPVLWFVKNHRRGRTLVNDVLRSDRRDKDGHDWGQGDGGIELLVQQLTDPDERIADPFAGTGQWGEIAVRMGRAWVGADVKPGGAAAVVA